MIHIVLIILKAIGIFLLAFLGLLLLGAMSVLLVPLRYSGRALKEGERLEGRFCVSWCLHLIHGTVSYRQGSAEWNLRIFGISLKKLGKLLERRQKKKRLSEGEEVPQFQRGLGEEAPQSQGSMGEEAPLHAEASESRKGQKESGQEGFRTVRLSGETGREGRLQSVLKKGLQSVKRLFGRFFRGIRWAVGLPGRIFRALGKICFTIQGICDKIEKWKSFVQEEETREAWKLVKRSAGRMARHVLPRKIKGRLLFGFEDPARTGRTLAALALFYPLYGRSLSLTPAFDRQALEGRVFFRGRIYGIFFVRTALKLWMDKNIKRTVKRFRRLENT